MNDLSEYVGKIRATTHKWKDFKQETSTFFEKNSEKFSVKYNF